MPNSHPFPSPTGASLGVSKGEACAELLAEDKQSTNWGRRNFGQDLQSWHIFQAELESWLWKPASGLLQLKHLSGPLSSPCFRAGVHGSRPGRDQSHTPCARATGPAGRPPGSSFSGQITLPFILSKPSSVACGTLRPLPGLDHSLLRSAWLKERGEKSWRKKRL